MLDHDVTWNCVAAWAAWLAAFGLILATWLFDWDRAAAHFGLAMSAAAATLHIRQMIHGLDYRERAAYRIGREDGQRGGTLHRV